MRERERCIGLFFLSFFFVIYKKKFIRKLQGQKGPWDLGERRVKVGSLGGGRGRGKVHRAGFLGE